MEKLSNLEMTKNKEIAENYKENRSKVTGELRKSLTEAQEDFLRGGNKEGELRKKLVKSLADGTYAKPSEFFKAECEWLFKGFIHDIFYDSFMYAVDNCVKYPYTNGYVRRPMRSERNALYSTKLLGIVGEYRRLYIPKTLTQIIEGDLTDEERVCVSFYRGNNYCRGYISYDIAYEIDKGNETVIKWAEEALDSGSAGAVDYDILRGVFMSGNGALHRKVGELLLAAKLQEGLRQAICETCDEGTFEAFSTILGFIRDADLVRFSSVKRAVGTWTGIVAVNSNDLDRIGRKEVELICRCLEDDDFCKECIASEDSMKSYTGLWAVACRSVEKALAIVDDIIDNGTHQQLLSAAYFIVEVRLRASSRKAAMKMLRKHTEKHDVVAVVLDLVIDVIDVDYYDLYYCGSTLEKALENSDITKEYCEEVYDILYGIYTTMEKKEEEIKSSLFPWYSSMLSKSELVRKLCIVCAVLQDNDKTDVVCQLIGEIEVKGYGSRSWELKVLLSEPKTDIQVNAVVNACADKEKYTREAAFEIVKKVELKPGHYRTFEDMLRYKNDQIRTNVIAILLKMDGEPLYETVERLITDKKEEKRTAALDIIYQLSQDEKREDIFRKCRPLLDGMKKPTAKERILIANIKDNENEPAEQEYGYGLYKEDDSYTPDWDRGYISDCQKVFLEYFPNSAICGGKQKDVKADFMDVLLKLDKLIEEHKNDEFSGRNGEAELLGNMSRLDYYDRNNQRLTAFSEMWDEFYEKEINDTKLLIRISAYLRASRNELFSDLKAELYGTEFCAKETIVYSRLIPAVINYLRTKYLEEEREKGVDTSFAYAEDEFICTYPDTKKLFAIQPTNYGHVNEIYAVDGELVKADGYVHMFTEVTDIGLSGCDDVKTKFAMQMRLAEKMGTFTLIEKNATDYRNSVPFPSVTDYIRAAYYGIITKGYMYKHFFTECKSFREVIGTLSEITGGYRELDKKVTNRARWGRWSAVNALGALIGSHERARENKLTDEDRKLAEFAVGIYETVAKLILDNELRRGDSEAQFSRSVNGFTRVYGMERFVQILSGLGKDTLDRQKYHYGSESFTKKVTFSRLLGVCIPNEDDDAPKLKKLIKGMDITEKRLVEAALYAPQWIDIIGEYLGWKGFRSACYYFMAHMNEYNDDVRQAIIAKYTPISEADLMKGAFDVKWFREAYETVGEKRFDVIYNAAKYISDGAKHSRARKYADAVMGKLSKEEAVKNITEKRNKDTLMAYPLIPLADEDDMVERYIFLQQFLKESKKFGAQRRASEAEAVEAAMKNLATNAGYDDIMRLTLRMETKLFDSVRELTEFITVGEIRVRLVIDEHGKTTVECEKGGKLLRSIPAKYKKDENIVRMNEVKKQLTEQYRRTRNMLEQAMEDRTAFGAGELEALSGNPVVYPILKDLVWVCGKDMGFLSDMALVASDGKKKKLKADSELIVAHPFDMYTAGVWRDYQKYLFDNRIVQTFKQVFRELYVKTEDEKEMFASRRYSGNQIQPKQTLGCLRSRRWVADIEDGLQKIYYKENIIARIYAMTDWFSPSEIEAPTLEWVEFSDRKTGASLRIDDIPDIIFSEVMRDVDLAVSVAHAGKVDPETSHSTIEMRRALCEFTMPLFKLDNVTFEKNHALISGTRGDYSVHLGSGVIHLQGGPMINVLPVHSQHRGKLFLPFADDDPKTSQILTEILMFAEDKKIKDPFILDQIHI